MNRLLPSKRRLTVGQEDEEPLSLLESNPTNLEEMTDPRNSEQLVDLGDGIHLTAAGVRSILNRIIRPKPLLRLICKACRRSTHDRDTYIPHDWLEFLGS